MESTSNTLSWNQKRGMSGFSAGLYTKLKPRLRFPFHLEERVCKESRRESQRFPVCEQVKHGKCSQTGQLRGLRRVTDIRGLRRVTDIPRSRGERVRGSGAAVCVLFVCFSICGWCPLCCPPCHVWMISTCLFHPGFKKTHLHGPKLLGQVFVVGVRGQLLEEEWPDVFK